MSDNEPAWPAAARGDATIPPKVVPNFDWTTPEGQWMAWANNEMGQLKLRIRKLEDALAAARYREVVTYDEWGNKTVHEMGQ